MLVSTYLSKAFYFSVAFYLSLDTIQFKNTKPNIQFKECSLFVYDTFHFALFLQHMYAKKMAGALKSIGKK